MNKYNVYLTPTVTVVIAADKVTICDGVVTFTVKEGETDVVVANFWKGSFLGYADKGSVST